MERKALSEILLSPIKMTYTYTAGKTKDGI